MALSLLLLSAPQAAGFAMGVPAGTVARCVTTRHCISPAVMSGSTFEPATNFRRTLAKGLAPCAATVLLVASLACAEPSLAVSGGGKDFSGQNLEGADFAGRKLVGKEFRGIQGANAVFTKANLASASFFKADLTGADLTNADLTGASLEEAGLEGATFDDAVLANSYLTKTIADAKSIRGADFSEAVMPTYTQRILCDRSDATGTNPKTGVETRESLMCP